MPAKSKSQQRLFGMVHAYQKGEFHGSRSLRNRVADLARRVSKSDAKHFAQTPHDGLPEKKAQAIIRPEDVQRLFAQLPPPDYERLIPERSEARRSVLSSAVHGALAGATIGSLGAGALGGLLGYKGSAGASAGDRAVATLLGALRNGAWGASRGAMTGAVTGTGFGIWNKLRS